MGRAEDSAKTFGEQSPTKGRRSKRGGNYPGGPGGRPTPDAELLFRLRIVERCLLDGKRGGQIIEELAKEGRTVPVGTVNHYMIRIRDKWAQEDSLLRPMWRERQMRKLHDVAEKLEADAAWGHWIACQKLIADLEGNLAPVKVEHSQRDPFDGWSLDELKAYVESEGEVVPERTLAISARNRKPGEVDTAEASDTLRTIH